MSSSPSPARAARVIRRPGSVLPPASVVRPHGMLPPTSATEPVASLEALLEVTRQEAFEEGRDAGLQAAAASAEVQRAAAVAAAAARISRAADDVGDVRAQVVDEVVSDVIGLAFELLEVLVGRELALAGEPVRDTVVRALALAPDRHGLVVRVHPECGLDDRDIAALAADPSVQVVRDPSVDLTGCEVTVGACHIDVQVPAALERVRQCLEAVRPGTARRGAVDGPGSGADGARAPDERAVEVTDPGGAP